MGMLQLAGAVSGLGKGMQQGLQNTQNYMTQSMIQKEREEMELKRIKLTYGLEEGLLQKKNDFAQANMKLQGAIDSGHITQKGKIESDQITQRGKVEGDLAAQKHSYNVELQGNEITARAQQNDLDRQSNKELTTLKLQFDAAEGARERKAAMERVQAHLGGEIVKLTQQLQATKGSDKLSAGVDRQIDYLMEMIKIDGRRLDSGLLTPEEMAPIEQRLKSYGNQIKQLTGGESKPRPPLVDPFERIAEVDKWRGAGPIEDRHTQATSPQPSKPNLPRFGNVEPTLADLVAFQGQYDAAQKSGGNVSAVVEAFKDRFGRIPTQADYDRIRNAGR